MARPRSVEDWAPVRPLSSETNAGHSTLARFDESQGGLIVSRFPCTVYLSVLTARALPDPGTSRFGLSHAIRMRCPPPRRGKAGCPRLDWQTVLELGAGSTA